MKRWCILVVFLLLNISCLWAQKTDFSGEFILNRNNSNWNGAPEHLLPKSVKVVQKKRIIYITKTNLDSKMQELPVITDTLDFKGTAFCKPAKVGGKIITVLKWLNEKSFQLDMVSPTTTMYEIWTMEDEGKVLHFTRVVDLSNGNVFTFQAFFDRKKVF